MVGVVIVVADEGLRALQGEYSASKDHKVGRYHKVWRPILDEYGLNNFGDVWRHLKRYKEVDQDTWLAGQGRVGSLNVLVRKMAGLVGLRDPEFVVENSNPWDEPIAAVLEHAFEAQRRAIGWNGEMKRTTLEGMLYGTGISKVGYGSQFLYDEVAWSGAVSQKNKGMLSSQERALPYGLSTEHNFRVQEGMPAAMHVSAADIFYNLGVKTEEDIRRVYHRSRRPLVDVLHDSRYDAKGKADVTLSRWGDGGDEWLHLNVYERDTAFVEVIECFDLGSRQYCVFTEHSQHFLRKWTPFPFPIQNPFHRFVPIPHPEDVWGIPYALLILGQAQAMNRLRAVIIDAISRDGKKIYLGNASSITDEEQRLEIERAKDGAFVWVHGLVEGEEPFRVVEFGGARPEILELTRIIERDQAWVSGLTDATRNDTNSSDETATAVSHRMEQQGLTVDEFVQESEAHQERVAGDMMKITMARWDPQRLVKVMGPDPNIYLWTSVNLERVLGSFTLRVIAGSSQKRDKATQRKQWLELLPRLAELDDRIKNDQAISQQTGQPGFLNWYEVVRETLSLFDTTIARKILRPDNMAMLAQRLLDTYQENPLYMSPELERQLRARGQQAVMQGVSGPAAGQEGLAATSFDPSGGGLPGLPSSGSTPGTPGGSPVPFEVRQGVPGVQSVNQATGGLPSEVAGLVGRLN